MEVVQWRREHCGIDFKSNEKAGIIAYNISETPRIGLRTGWMPDSVPHLNGSNTEMVKCVYMAAHNFPSVCLRYASSLISDRRRLRLGRMVPALPSVLSHALQVG